MLPSNAFWTNEAEKLWKDLLPLLMQVIVQAGETGYDQLPPPVQILMDWDWFNQAAIDYLNQYRLSWVQGISDSARDEAMGIISEWIQSGDTKKVLDQKLGLALGAARAQRIATTEITRIYAKGNILAWQSTQIVSGKRWMTAKDERVCPLCRPMHKKVVSLDDVYTQSITDVAESPAMKALAKSPEAAQQKASTLIRHSGAFFESPPRHPNCRCWLQPVVSEESVARESERILAEFSSIPVYLDVLRDEYEILVV